MELKQVSNKICPPTSVHSQRVDCSQKYLRTNSNFNVPIGQKNGLK